MADFSSMFGAYAQPQGGGMFGQQQSPLMQMLGGMGGMTPEQQMQIAQRLMAMGGPTQAPSNAGMFGSVFGQPQMPGGMMPRRPGAPY